jgi:hypothetical protein
MLEMGLSGLMSGEGKPPAASRSRSSAFPRLYVGAVMTGSITAPLASRTCRTSTNRSRRAATARIGCELPWLEALIRALVLIGFVMRYALITGAVLILALTFGSTLRQEWEIAGLQLTYMLGGAILLALRRHNTVSINSWLNSAAPTQRRWHDRPP